MGTAVSSGLLKYAYRLSLFLPTLYRWNQTKLNEAS